MLLKKYLFAAICICFLNHLQAQIFPVASININGADTNRVNLVFLSDGFQAAQLDSFKSKVNGIQAYVFNEPPFKQYAKFFNVYAIEVPSVDSGVTHPGTATDVTEPAFPVATRNIYFNSKFDNGGVHRAVSAKNSAAVYSVLNDNFPMYDVPMVLVNTPEYGGTGGGYLTFTINTSANETAVHELGHTFGKVWDEYWNNMPGEHPNMTQESNSALIVWKNWVNTNFIGIYAHGTSGQQATWYRPHQNCKMRYLGSPLCSVCKENIIDRIYDKVNPIEAVTPNTTTPINVLAGSPMTFGFSPILPNPSTFKYKWTLNGNVINTTDTSVQINQSQLNIGNNVLTAVITDTTLLSRSYNPASGYMFSVVWNLKRSWNTTVSTVSSNNKFVYALFPVPARNVLNLRCNNSTNASALNYTITSITGSKTKEGTLAIVQGEQTIPLDIANLTPGTYSCTLQGDGIYVNEKIIIE